MGTDGDTVLEEYGGRYARSKGVEMTRILMSEQSMQTRSSVHQEQKHNPLLGKACSSYSHSVALRSTSINE